MRKPSPGELALMDQIKKASGNGDMDEVVHLFHQLPVDIRHHLMQVTEDMLAAFIIGDALAHQHENEEQHG